MSEKKVGSGQISTQSRYVMGYRLAHSQHKGSTHRELDGLDVMWISTS